ncbi:MAG: peptidylprolyl isomerase [Pseudolabrys sp.]|nr:peptidylprolyl isomerase [Pseudolabrys sp.]
MHQIAGVPETVDIAMPGMSVKLRPIRRWLTGAVIAAVLAAPAAVNAQVVVVANGSPITELDIQQRSKLITNSTQKTLPRQDVINELINDRLKIAKAKVYGLDVSDSEVDAAFDSLAQRQRLTPQQFTVMLERGGISASTLKARMRAELTWNQLIRGKFGSSLQVGESDIANALRTRNEGENATVGYIYTLYPVTIVVARGSSEAIMGAKRREAENLRSRFTTCNEGLALARALRDVAVREPLHRSSADLAPQLRELLGNMQIGQLSMPEVTAQGLQMYALCDKKESIAESSVKREVREQIYSKRFEAEAKKFLDEIRKQAMIEYK